MRVKWNILVSFAQDCDEKLMSFVSNLSEKPSKITFAAALVGVVLFSQNHEELVRFCRAAGSFQPLSDDYDTIEKTGEILTSIFDLSLSPNTLDEVYYGGTVLTNTLKKEPERYYFEQSELGTVERFNFKFLTGRQA